MLSTAKTCSPAAGNSIFDTLAMLGEGRLERLLKRLDRYFPPP